MSNKKLMILLAVMTLVQGAFPQAQAQECNPLDFMLQKDTNYNLWSNSVKLAFLKVANSEQYKQSQEQWNSGGSYGPYAGYLDYGTAKSMASKEFELMNLDFEQNQYYEYLQERLSPAASAAYSDCLEKSKNTDGLKVWVAKRQAAYVTVKAFWVGTTSNGRGNLDADPTARGVTFIQAPPQSWERAKTYEFLVRRDPDVDGFIALSVGGMSASVVLLKDLPQIKYGSVNVCGVNVTANSGGKGGHNTCGSRCVGRESSCVESRHGGYFAAGSGAVDQLSESGAGNSVTIDYKPQRVCANFLSATGAREVYIEIKGRVIAKEIFPIDPTSTEPIVSNCQPTPR